jgi:hypothetical protein
MRRKRGNARVSFQAVVNAELSGADHFYFYRLIKNKINKLIKSKATRSVFIGSAHTKPHDLNVPFSLQL